MVHQQRPTRTTCRASTNPGRAVTEAGGCHGCSASPLITLLYLPTTTTTTTTTTIITTTSAMYRKGETKKHTHTHTHTELEIEEARKPSHKDYRLNRRCTQTRINWFGCSKRFEIRAERIQRNCVWVAGPENASKPAIHWLE